ncbi:hypothetical protein SAMN05421854_107385 [Amycolatopsis rubida]|uniref:Uncharacterized protein n=1 Tax=Amycolatopsis rubida TaxID=112413 RepID=A0A1I5U3X8_9PSEU|nr:hypothetical protein SAMN05421854_107385 [Amycolatopsis rubida]
MSCAIRLLQPPRLVWPTTEVGTCYLVGEQAGCLLEGRPAEWLDSASDDSAGFVAARRAVGSAVHGLLVRLRRVLPGRAGRPARTHRRTRRSGCLRGGTRTLAAGLAECRSLDRVLLTWAADNEPSRRVILSNGGAPDGRGRGENRFRFDLAADGVSRRGNGA